MAEIKLTGAQLRKNIWNLIIERTVRKGRLFTGVTQNLLSLALPLSILQIYDRIIPNSSIETLGWLILGAISASIMEGVIRYYRSLEGVYEADSFDYYMNQILFRSIFSDQKPSSEKKMALLESFNSISTLRELFSGEFSSSLLDAPFTIVFIGIIASLSPAMAILLTVILAVYLVFTHYVLIPLSTDASEDQSRTEQNLTNYLLGTFSNLLNVKSYHSEEKVLRKAEFLIDNNIFKSFRNSFVGLLTRSFNEVNSQILFYGVIALGAFLVTNGKMTIGELTACSFMTRRVFQPIQSIASMLVKYRKFELAMEKIIDVLPEESEINEEPSTYEKVTKNQFFGEVEVSKLENSDFPNLTQKNFHFRAKRTYLLQSSDRLLTAKICRLITSPNDGFQSNLSIDGLEGRELSSETLNDIIGYVSPANSVFSGKVMDNITVFDLQKVSIAQDVITMLGKNSLINELPNGFNTEIDSKTVGFYPGLKEVISLSRQLVKFPRILILERVDEVMDKSDLNSLIWLLKMLHGKLTIIAISKSSALAGVADEVIALQTKENIDLTKPEGRA